MSVPGGPVEHDAAAIPAETAAWVRLSARLQRIAAARTARTDLVLRISPELDSDPAGWSGWYRHDLAEIRLPASTLLGAHLGPYRVDLSTWAGRRASAALAGALSLASAHAVHTTWARASNLAPAVRAATDLLERARVVRIQLEARPADRRWLRAAISCLGAGPAQNAAPWLALDAIGLELAGCLSHEEARLARDHVAATAGAGTASVLEQLLREGIALPDGDRKELLAHAERLAAALGTPRLTTGGRQSEDEPGAEDLRRMLAKLADPDSPYVSQRPALTRDQELELAERDLARAASTAVFADPCNDRDTTYREPDAELRGAARSLAGALRRARYRSAAVTSWPSSAPPGRMRLAEAMRREAQQAAGAQVTAKPWLQTRRRSVEMPPLRVGLSWDISRSRSAVHSRMADLAWALSWAMHHVDGALAAVAWNSRTRPVQWPGQVPTAVAQPPCGGSSSACPQSLRALDGALDLHEPLGARIVIVATDGQVPNRRAIRAEVDRLVQRGVVVLWVLPHEDAWTPPGATAVVTLHPDSLVSTLGDAVCRALARAMS